MGKHLKKLSMAFAVVFSLSTVFSANVTSAKAADSEIALMAETVCTTVEEAAERLREGREALEKEVRIQIKFKEGEWEKYGYKDYKDCWRIVSDLAMGEDGTGVEDQYIANITKRRSYSIDNYSSVNRIKSPGNLSCTAPTNVSNNSKLYKNSMIYSIKNISFVPNKKNKNKKRIFIYPILKVILIYV